MIDPESGPVGRDITRVADRDAVNEILISTKEQNYPLRTMIHEIVASDLFRTR